MQFEITSGKIRVTDPCYEKGLGGDVVDAKNGIWNVTVEQKYYGTWGLRNRRLIAEHAKHRESDGHRAMSINDDIGVDSGQAGFFDDSIYPDGDTGEYNDETTFYGKACAATNGASGFGTVLGKGVVSSSGFGDGVYTLRIYGRNGMATKLELTFVEEDEQ